MSLRRWVSSATALLRAVAVLSIHIAALFIVLVLVTGVAPRCQWIFHEIGQRLPINTRLISHLAGLVMAYWHFLLLLLGAYAVGTWLLSESPLGGTWLKAAWLSITAVGLVVFMDWAIHAAYSPFRGIIEDGYF